MYKYKFSLILFLLVCLVSSCRKDDINTDTDRIPPIPQVNVETSISGTITDSYGMPISGADVSVINETTESNQFGYFEITGLVGETQAVIKVEKTGYFNQFKTFVPNQNAVDRTRIRLIEKTNPQSLSSAAGGQVTIEGGTKVDFQANSFIDESGNPYTGQVSVYSFYIDPTDADLDMIMPGNLMARNTDDELSLLQSFGMTNVELEGSAGQKLNINKPATLTMEVPNSIVSNAPASIPLWYFDEYTGYWMEEGTAQLIESQYVGTVNHFTFWNCDIDIEFFTYLSGQVVNASGDPLVKVRITDLSTAFSAADWTDDDGNFEGYVPMNVDLLLEVMDVCGSTVIYSENIGPFTTSPTDIGQINISSAPGLIEISGVLNGCNGEPVSNGEIVMSLSGSGYPQSINVESDGSFAFVTTVCGATEIEITAIDYTNFMVGDPITYPVTPNMELGTINVCGLDVTESVVFVVDGVTKVIPWCTVEISTGGGQTSYLFEFIDSMAGPGELPVIYTWTLHDVNNDLTNPEWTTNIGYAPPSTIQDSLRVIANFGPVPGTTDLIQEAVNPGDILSLKFDDVVISVADYFQNGDIMFTTYAGGKVTFNAKLQ